MRRGFLAGAVLVALIALPPAALAGPHRASAHAAKHHKRKHKKHKHPTTTTGGGPSMTVVGFGMNHLYVADGKTVSAPADCSTMVQGNGYPYGPPQNVYVEAYIKASGIPATAPTQIGESFPEAAAPDIHRTRMALLLSSAIPWSQAFDASTLGFGTPPGSQADIFRGGLFSTNAPNGPSASDFDGTYSFEVSVMVAGKTLDSTATVTISC